MPCAFEMAEMKICYPLQLWLESKLHEDMTCVCAPGPEANCRSTIRFLKTLKVLESTAWLYAIHQTIINGRAWQAFNAHDRLGTLMKACQGQIQDWMLLISLQGRWH